MLSLSDLERVRIRSRSEVRGAAESFQSIIGDSLALRISPCHNLATSQPMVDDEGNVLASHVFGWTEGSSWWERPESALKSPLVAGCRVESEPFWCNSDGFRTTRFNPYLRSIDLGKFSERSMTNAAIVSPVHLPFGQVGCVSFVSCDPSCRDLSEVFSAHADLLGLYSRTFIAGYASVMTRVQRLPASQVLSRRETECIRWVAVGKTDDEIARLMSLKRTTVRFHMKNAANKLQTVNRSQTVLKASQLAYIKLVGYAR